MANDDGFAINERDVACFRPVRNESLQWQPSRNFPVQDRSPPDRRLDWPLFPHFYFHSGLRTFKGEWCEGKDMSADVFELAELAGEHVDGPAHTQSTIDLTVERRGDRVVLTQTARRRAVPDRSVRSELDPEAAEALRRELGELIEE